MAFLEQLLPVTVAPGATSAPAFLTSIKQLRGGGEYRNALWRDPLRSFSVRYNARDVERIEDELLTFMFATSGSLHGFRAKDWSDFAVEDEQFAVGDGTTSWFRLTKRYGTYSRRIMKPDAATVTIKFDGSSVDPDHYAVDGVNGTVIFFEPPPVTTMITWSGEFHVPVRFEDDALPILMATRQTGMVPDIKLREVRVREDIDTDFYDDVIAILGSYDWTDVIDLGNIIEYTVNTHWQGTWT